MVSNLNLTEPCLIRRPKSVLASTLELMAPPHTLLVFWPHGRTVGHATLIASTVAMDKFDPSKTSAGVTGHTLNNEFHIRIPQIHIITCNTMIFERSFVRFRSPPARLRGDHVRQLAAPLGVLARSPVR